MAIRLTSQRGHLTLSNADWYKTVQLANQHGFTPPKQPPTLFRLEPFTLPARVTAAFHAALLRALPTVAEEPNAFYELFERHLLGSDIPTAEACLHLAGKHTLLRQVLVVMDGEVNVVWVPDTEDTSGGTQRAEEHIPAQAPPLKEA